MNAKDKAVIAVRLDGRRVLFGRYTADEAQRTAAGLRRLQMGAEVVPADEAPGVPGASLDPEERRT